jgi:hypothetical protein
LGLFGVCAGTGSCLLPLAKAKEENLLWILLGVPCKSGLWEQGSAEKTSILKIAPAQNTPESEIFSQNSRPIFRFRWIKRLNCVVLLWLLWQKYKIENYPFVLTIGKGLSADALVAAMQAIRINTDVIP